jgi:hypothetical protein
MLPATFKQKLCSLLAHGEAEQIFAHLKKKGVFYDYEIRLPNNGMVIAQTFKDQLEVSRFINQKGVVEMNMVPFFEWIKINPLAAVIFAGLTYLIVTPLGGFLSKFGELMAERLVPK